MNDIPSYLEDKVSQIPALQMLIQLGYEYIAPEEAFRIRGSKTSNVLLDSILQEQLNKINSIQFRDGQYTFSNHNISKAIDALKTSPFDGLVATNERIYDLLCLGKSFEETIAGETRSFTLKYIDWDNIENNAFHVTAEFPVARSGSEETRRPDIVLFINGIPLVVIECKAPTVKDPVGQAISQHIRNQRDDEIERLFLYSQLLLALSPNESKYATTATPAKFWTLWKEREVIEDIVGDLANRPLSNTQRDRLFSGVFAQCKNYFRQLEELGPRLVTEQDRVLYCLCRKQRLMELVFRFVVYDAGEKKVTRYQQYFTVKSTVERAKTLDHGGCRNGGVIWHTQGSGKSITMVMLAKALALEPSIKNPRILIVTDRVNLDEQIHDTFHHCGKEPVRAKTGKHLLELLEQQREAIVTTVIDKFDAAFRTRQIRDDSNEIFVLVDESHRSQYGEMHSRMRKVLPKACYIGFTGTPLLKDDKSTAIKFGGFIEPTYTIDQAVEDKVVVRLLYEGRHAMQKVDEKAIDDWFERVSVGLSDMQKADLKRKFSQADHLNEADQKIYRVAYDISDHFAKNWQGTRFKGQLAAPSRLAALKYKQYLDEFGMVSSEVLVCGPDTRENNEDVYEDPKDELRRFWTATMKKYGNEAQYNRLLVNKFKSDDQPEIIIVVSKLLTGFDAPRNTVLYLTKPMVEHNLLQAIARVNRICEGKDFGYVIDYYGVLGDLNQALNNYRALENFESEDIEDAILSVHEEVGTLKQKHSSLWDVFKSIKNRMDQEEYEQLLADEALREQFYRRLSLYARTLSVALSTVRFIEETDETEVETYKRDLRFFQKLRISVKHRYAEQIDYRQYEKKVQKLIDTYIKTDEILQITPLVDIFDKEGFQQEVDKLESPRARADTIANRTKKTITEKWEEDPAFYKRFSKLLEETIAAFMEKRLSDAEYLDKVTQVMEAVRDRKGDDIPDALQYRNVAKAFFGLVRESVAKYNASGQDHKGLCADIALQIDEIIIKNKGVDWINNPDIQNQMLNEMEDYLYQLKDSMGVPLTFDDMDAIMEQSLSVARKRYAE